MDIVIFKDEFGKAYVAVDRYKATRDQALKLANNYFKEAKESLVVGIGHMDRDDLAIRRRGGNAYVVSRKERV